MINESQISNIAKSSMERLLFQRKYETDENKKYVEMIAEDVRDKLIKFSDQYCYDVFVVLIRPGTLHLVKEKANLNLQTDIHIRCDYKNKEFIGYTYIFACFLPKRSPQILTSFSLLKNDVNQIINKQLLNYFYKREDYDPNSVEQFAEWLKQSIFDDLREPLIRFAFCINIYIIKRSNSISSTSIGKGHLNDKKDGSTFQTYVNNAYGVVVKVAAFYNC